jgi:type II secretory pathway pseudopilin PulG
MDTKAKLFLGISLLLFIAVTVYSFYTLGNPWQTLAKNRDEQRLNHISDLKLMVDSYYQRVHKLPSTLQDVTTTVKDPSSQKLYDYFMDTDTDYRLCASFETNAYETNTSATPEYSLPMSSSVNSFAIKASSTSANYRCFSYSVAPTMPTFAPRSPTQVPTSRADNIIAHWSLTDTPIDKKYYDSSGNNYMGTSATVLSRTTHVSNSDAIVFSGTERITLGNLPAVPQGTLMMWIKPYQINQPDSVFYPFYGAGGFFGRQIPETSSSLIFSFKSNDSLIPMFLLGNRPNVNTTAVLAKTNLQPNTWHHLAATWNITNSRVSIYVNGIKEGEKSDVNPDTGGGDVDLGSVRNNMSKFIGAIADIYYFDKELNSTDIAKYAGL